MPRPHVRRSTSVTDPRRGPASLRTAVYALVFVAFTDTFALLPTVGPYAASFGADALGVGVAVGAYSATNLVFNLVGGALLDRVGRRGLLLAGLAAVGVSVGAYALVSSTGGLLVVRLLHGAAGGILVPAVFTVVGDLTPRGEHGRAMGRAGAVIGSAAIVAPGAAGALREVAGFSVVFLALSAVALVGILVAATSLPRTTPEGYAEGTGATVRSLVARTDLQAAFAGVLSLTFAMGSLAAFLPLHVEALGWRASATGLLFTAFAIAAAAVMLSGAARRVDRHGLRGPVLAGLLVLAVALAALVTAPPAGPTVAAVLVFGLGYGLLFPATAGYVAAATSPASRGRAFGLFNVFFSLGLAVGPAAGGLLGRLLPEASPFLAATVVSVTGAVVVWHRLRPRQRGGPPPAVSAPGGRRRQ